MFSSFQIFFSIDIEFSVYYRLKASVDYMHCQYCIPTWGLLFHSLNNMVPNYSVMSHSL